MKLEKFPFKSCKWWSTNAVLKSLFFTKATGAVLQMTLNWTGGWCVSFSHCNSQCYTFVPFVLEEFRFKKCVIGPFSAQRIVIVQLLLHAWFFGTFIFPFICALCFGGWGKDIYCTFCLLCACQSNFESPGYWNIKPCLTTNSFYPSNSTVHWKSIKENQKWLLTPSEIKQILFFSLTSFSITITDVLMKSLACCSC